MLLLALVVLSGVAPGVVLEQAAAAPVSSAAPAVPSSLTGRWTWPLPAPHDVVRGYVQPAEAWSPGHRGVDIAAADGAVVVAPEAGVVHFTGTVVDRPVVSIEHRGGVLSSFEPVAGVVKQGEAVARGQPIGVLVTGHCGVSVCLHLGARVDGRYVNPLLLLGELRPAVLLPTRPVP
ncbi:peptidase M23-like protein [Frondihabitans australicus]|uniref:Peptidase M23-like protein n=1 Tax=Frondihabitans australicus TaxID=386892 RepID=A0A495IEV7_9MICO|nr:peptidase M23-like protein [Frondihabitans australicus]